MKKRGNLAKLKFILDESDIFWRGSCSNATEMILKAEELGKVKQIFLSHKIMQDFEALSQVWSNKRPNIRVQSI